MRKKMTIFFAGAIVCLALGWYWFNKPRESVQFKSTDVSISAIQLYEAYNNNEADADKLYLNKVVEVKGVVDDFTNSGEDIIVTLELQPTGGGISCRLSPGEKFEEKTVSKGMEITIKGKCTGFNMDVNLADCIIIL